LPSRPPGALWLLGLQYITHYARILVLKETIRGLERPTNNSRLPEQTSAFVQRAFSDGIIELVDKRNGLNEMKRKEWERRKWFLVRNIVDSELPHRKLGIYAGINAISHVSKLYRDALVEIWEAAPTEVQRQFPKEGLVAGKRRGAEKGNKMSLQTKEKISATMKNYHEKGRRHDEIR